MRKAMDADKINTQLALHNQEIALLKGTMGEVVRGLGEVRDAILKQPAATSYESLIRAIGGTAAVLIAIFGLMNGWFDSRSAPAAQTLLRIEREAADIPVLRYQIQQLERALKKQQQLQEK
jgi:phage-related protein